MSKLFLLAFAHMRKSKAQTAVLVGLFLIASILSNISLMILLDFTNSFEQIAEELQTSDLFFAIPEWMYTDEVEQYFLDHEEIDHFQVNQGLVVNITQPAEAIGITVIANRDEARTISDWRLVGDHMSELDRAIYVPYHFKVSSGYQLGDEFILEIEGRLYEFNIAGFSESLFQNGPFIGDVFFIPEVRFNELSTVLADSRFMLIFANGAENHAMIEMDLLQLTGASSASFQANDIRRMLLSGDFASIQTFRTLMPSMIAAMLLVFTGIIIVVCLLVIHFKIKNSIDEDMPQLGLLQSVGYTSKQLAIAITAQYGIIAIISCLVSIIPAYLITPVISNLFARQNSFFWIPPINLLVNMSVVLVSFTIALITAYLTAIKIRRIAPIQALRSGIQTHNFKKNHFSLEHSKLPLQLVLAFKSALQNKRQTISMFIIIASVSFVATIATIMYYNAIIDTTIFQTVPGIERMDVRIVFIPDEEEEAMLALKEEVRMHSDVYNAQYLDMGRITVDNVIVGVVVMQNYEARVINNVYEGIFPRHENEIAISGYLANLLNKGVGDTVLVGEEELPYLITGLSQGMEAGDLLTTYLTTDGIRRIQPDFIQSSLAIYVNEGVNISEFIRQMEIQFEGRHFFVEDSETIFAEGMAPFVTIMSIVSVAIIVVSSAVIMLVLYFVIGSAITHKRRELGIQKAMGYTTFSQMQQITFTFIAPFVLGVTVGCAVGSVTVNILMSIGMQAAGVMQINYLINPIWVVAIGVGILILSYLSSIFMTWRIRKISAYALVSE